MAVKAFTAKSAAGEMPRVEMAAMVSDGSADWPGAVGLAAVQQSIREKRREEKLK